MKCDVNVLMDYVGKRKSIGFVLLLVSAILFAACSDSKVAGGSSDDAGIIADLNVAGVSQKGPFVKGSAVTVQGIDCKTMELTGERFDGVVKSISEKRVNITGRNKGKLFALSHASQMDIFFFANHALFRQNHIQSIISGSGNGIVNSNGIFNFF